MELILYMTALVSAVFGGLETLEARRASRTGNFEDEVRWQLRAAISWMMILFCILMAKGR